MQLNTFFVQIMTQAKIKSSQRRNFMKLIVTVVSLLLISCGSSKDNKANNDNNAAFTSNLPDTFVGLWLDKEDVEIINNLEANDYECTFFFEYDKNGKPLEPKTYYIDGFRIYKNGKVTDYDWYSSSNFHIATISDDLKYRYIDLIEKEIDGEYNSWVEMTNDETLIRYAIYKDYESDPMKYSKHTNKEAKSLLRILTELCKDAEI